MSTAPILTSPLDGVRVLGPVNDAFRSILTDDALAFVANLARKFRPEVDRLLARRLETQLELDEGRRPTFLGRTEGVRKSQWQVARLPEDLKDRRVEITGPVDRKMIINALNSGANVFMADFEDSNAPTWANCMDGQVNLRDAVDGGIEYLHPTRGTLYTLNDTPATLMVRPRGWHLEEAHLEVDGRPVPAGLFDFGLYFFHNAETLVSKGSGPYFYLPKLEGYLEARLWNDVFVFAQHVLEIRQGSIKATVLIETILAAFQMDEILWELREHSAGLNCGRWDYIFSVIKKFAQDPKRILPDRDQVGMTQPFMAAYTALVIKTCHRRGVHAMGGMAAQIPIKGDVEANEAALEKVRRDKLREVLEGHDGTWVAHPGLVGIAKEIFDSHMPQPNQLGRLREDVSCVAEELLAVPSGTRSLEGLRCNVRVGLQYLEAWLRGQGCVPINHLMEDAATAEISRAQIWQWIRHGAKLKSGETITAELFDTVLREELDTLSQELGEDRWITSEYPGAARLMNSLCKAETMPEFLTLQAYPMLIKSRS